MGWRSISFMIASPARWRPMGFTGHGHKAVRADGDKRLEFHQHAHICDGFGNAPAARQILQRIQTGENAHARHKQAKRRGDFLRGFAACIAHAAGFLHQQALANRCGERIHQRDVQGLPSYRRRSAALCACRNARRKSARTARCRPRLLRLQIREERRPARAGRSWASARLPSAARRFPAADPRRQCRCRRRKRWSSARSER